MFSRYLQHTSKNPLPPLALLSMTNIVAFLIYLPRVLYRIGLGFYRFFAARRHNSLKSNLKDFFTFYLEFVKTDLLKNWMLWVFVSNLMLRSATNVLSSRWTQAIYVQLIALSTPFLVSFIASGIAAIHTIYLKAKSFGVMPYPENIKSTLFEDERINWKMLIAIVISTIGATLIIFGGVGQVPEGTPWYNFLITFKIDFSKLTTNITWLDLIGMILALISAACLAFYMITIRFMKTSANTGSVIHLNNGEDVFTIQVFSISTLAIPSLIFEDWSPFLRLELFDWIMFFAFAFLVFFIANWANVYSIQTLGAATAGSMLSLRLISILIGATIILGERLFTIWPLVGSLIVICGVTGFMIVKHYGNKPISNKPREQEVVKPEEVQLQEETVGEQNQVEEHHVEVEIEPSIHVSAQQSINEEQMEQALIQGEKPNTIQRKAVSEETPAAF